MCEIYKNLSLEDMKGEVWEDIEGYEGLYQVSNMGRVKSLPRKRGATRLIKPIIKKQEFSKQGYLRITLYKSSKTKRFQVHRLVAKTFISNSENKQQVNHINEDKTDNRVENLEWTTPKENSNWGSRNERMNKTKTKNGIIKSLYKSVLQYDLEGNFIKEWESTAEYGRSGYNRGHVAACCRGEEKQHKGSIWKYKEEVK